MMMHTYPEPVARLVQLGEPPSYKGNPPLDYAAHGITPEHVPDLLRMLQDMELWGQENPPGYRGAEHALEALKQLPPTFDILRTLLDILPHADNMSDELGYGEWISETFEEALNRFGVEGAPLLLAFVRDPAHGTYSTNSAAMVLVETAAQDPDVRAALIDALTVRLERFKTNDETLNAFLIGVLVEVKATQAAALIKRAYDADTVDTSIYGNWRTVELDLELDTPTPEEAEERAHWAALQRGEISLADHRAWLDAKGIVTSWNTMMGSAAPQSLETDAAMREGAEKLDKHLVRERKAKKNKRKMAKASRKKNRRK